MSTDPDASSSFSSPLDCSLKSNNIEQTSLASGKRCHSVLAQEQDERQSPKSPRFLAPQSPDYLVELQPVIPSPFSKHQTADKSHTELMELMREVKHEFGAAAANSAVEHIHPKTLALGEATPVAATSSCEAQGYTIIQIDEQDVHSIDQMAEEADRRKSDTTLQENHANGENNDTGLDCSNQGLSAPNQFATEATQEAYDPSMAQRPEDGTKFVFHYADGSSESATMPSTPSSWSSSPHVSTPFLRGTGSHPTPLMKVPLAYGHNLQGTGCFASPCDKLPRPPGPHFGFSTPRGPFHNITLNSSGEEQENISPMAFPRPPANTPTVDYSSEPCTPQRTPFIPINSGRPPPNIITPFLSGKEGHNEKERQRSSLHIYRSRIKTACQMMREQVPGLTDKTDKATAFEFAVQYILFLKHKVGNSFDAEFLAKYSPY